MLELFNSFRWSIQKAAWKSPRPQTWSLERSMNRIEGERHLKARNYDDAEKFLALAVAEADEKRHSVRKVQLRLYLAEAQRKQGKLGQAEATVRTALEHTARISNPTGYVQCLDSLAEVFHDADNFPAMEKVLQEGVRIEAAMPRPDPLRMARRIHRLGIARHKNGRSEDAIPALEKSVALHEQNYGEQHIETANLLADLGVVHRAQGNYEAAQVYLRRALRVHEGLLGMEAPETIADLHQLAGALEDGGDTEAAAAEYERVLQSKERAVGGNMDEIAEMQYSLAGMYIGWNNFGRARELLTSTAGIFKRARGARLAVTYETLAYVDECCGRFPEAVAELAQAAKVWESCGAERSAELAENMRHRAELLDQMRKKSEAEWLRIKAQELAAAAGQAT